MQDLATILSAAGVESHQARQSVSLVSECVNCKADNVIAAYAQALLQIPQAACQVCRYYASDFACLGYALPDTCSSC